MADLVSEFVEFRRSRQAGAELLRTSSAAATWDRRAPRARPARSDHRANPGPFPSTICVPRPDGGRGWALAAAHRVPSGRVRSVGFAAMRVTRETGRLCRHAPQALASDAAKSRRCQFIQLRARSPHCASTASLPEKESSSIIPNATTRRNRSRSKLPCSHARTDSDII